MSELKMLGDRLEREWIYRLEDKLVCLDGIDEKVIRHSDFLEVCEFITRLYKQERRRKFKTLPKQSKKKTIRSYENGIKTFPDGRERCVTKAAWEKRKDEVFARDSFGTWPCWECICTFTSDARAAFDVDHIRKRSLGRDDRLSNLQLLCLSCHRKKHDEFRKSK